MRKMRLMDAVGQRLPRAKRPRERIFGLRLFPFRQDRLVDLLLADPVAGTGLRMVATANLSHIVALRKDPRFRAAYRGAWIVTADGMPVYLYAKLLGLKVSQRITGADFVPALLKRLRPEAHRLFAIASSLEAAKSATRQLLESGFAEEAIGFAVPPYGFERDADEEAALIEQVRRHRPTHILMSLGAPKSETWLHAHRDRLGDAYVLSCGAALDFMAGLRRRAPVPLSYIGLEWLWRFACEPRRLFRRYFIDSWAMWPAIVADLASRGERVGITDD